jgi:SAM-dependent methyltransferase
MQQDYRATLYGHYVSAFKAQSAAAPSSVWWDHKYLPLLAGLDRAAAILELGCGGGALLRYLTHRGFLSARGIDVSAEQVAIATSRGVHADCADALTHLKDRALTLDAVIAVDVLEHLTRDELLELSHLMRNALRPGGRLLVQTANGAGFVGLRFYEAGPIPIRLRGKLNVALWNAIKLLANTVRHIETGKRQSIWTENFICLAFKPC